MPYVSGMVGRIAAVSGAVQSRLSFAAVCCASALTAFDARGGELEDYLAGEYPAADGFDEPRPGRAQIPAIATGRVESVTSGKVAIEHTYYENHEKKKVRSVYGHLSEIPVRAGQVVTRGELVGKRLERGDHVQVIDAADRPLPSSFFADKKSLFLPAEEPVLVLVDQESYRLAIYHRGKLQKTVEIGLGQAKGKKERQGDLKTPKGMYFVIHKTRGEFSGRYGGYYGGHWIKLNYPNAFDAARGLAEGWIDAARAHKIAAAWKLRKPTDEKSKLGGGIGLHGWIEEWDAEKDGAHLSWGCVVLHLRDISAIFDAIPSGAMVVIM